MTDPLYHGSTPKCNPTAALTCTSRIMTDNNQSGDDGNGINGFGKLDDLVTLPCRATPSHYQVFS